MTFKQRDRCLGLLFDVFLGVFLGDFLVKRPHNDGPMDDFVVFLLLNQIQKSKAGTTWRTSCRKRLRCLRHASS